MGMARKVAVPTPAAGAPARFPLPSLIIPAVYIAALVYARDWIPVGLNNDAAAEGLRGLYLVGGPHFEVITFSVGNSAETLYLYLDGVMAKLLGPTTLSLQLTGWLFALACMLLVWKLVERISSTVPAWVPLLTTACSLWLFHYARSGLRAISAPVFLAAFTLLLDRAERRPGERREGLLCGAILGLSIYAYTSARILPIAFLLYAAQRLVRSGNGRRGRLRVYAGVMLGAFIVSVPNFLFFVNHPHEFLSRGNYVLRGTAADNVINVVWSALCPLVYPDVYRTIAGRTFLFDGVSAGLTSAGFSPLHIVYSLALLLGIWQLRRFWNTVAANYLVCVWIASVLILGISGPSLTRLLILLPVYLVFVALGFGYVIEWRASARYIVLALVLWVGVNSGYEYLSGAGASPEYYGGPATAIGEAAASLGVQGRRVLCIIARDSSVVQFLTHNETTQIRIAEFYQRPLNAAELPSDFLPDSLLVEKSPAFAQFLARIRPELIIGNNPRFVQVRLR
jgi:hypothetical protein